MKQPTPEQVEAAIEKWGEVWSDKWGAENVDTMDFALRFLQKAMGEPSVKAIDAAFEPGGYDDAGVDDIRAERVWEAMRDQMLREVSDE